MNEIVKFLTDNPTFYLATVEEGHPRVRPFGAVMEFEGRLYFATNNTKSVYKQLLDNPSVEISVANAEGEWIRLTGRAVMDCRREARAAMLEAAPVLKQLYSLDDGIFEVFYLEGAKAVMCSLSGRPPRTLEA